MRYQISLSTASSIHHSAMNSLRLRRVIEFPSKWHMVRGKSKLVDVDIIENWPVNTAVLNARNSPVASIVASCSSVPAHKWFRICLSYALVCSQHASLGYRVLFTLVIFIWDLSIKLETALVLDNLSDSVLIFEWTNRRNFSQKAVVSA